VYKNTTSAIKNDQIVYIPVKLNACVINPPKNRIFASLCLKMA